MNIFKNKFLIKLIATICLFLALISFGTPTKVYAEDTEWGGVLITPVVNLLTAIGDGILELLHSSVQSQQISMIKIDGSENWKNVLAFFGAALVAILAAAAVIVAVVATGGAAAWVAAELGITAIKFGTTITLGLGTTALATGVLAGTAAYDGWIPDDIYLPAFSITAEEIFSNEIALFDVNFFQPNKYYGYELKEKDDQSVVESESSTGPVSWIVAYENLFANERLSAERYGETIIPIEEALAEDKFKTMINKVNEKLSPEEQITKDKNLKFKIYENVSEAGPYQEIGTFTSTYHTIQTNKFAIIDGETNMQYMIITSTLEHKYTETTSITAGETVKTKSDETFKETLSYHIIDPVDADEEAEAVPQYEVVEVEIKSTAAQLQGVVAKWYFILRNIALVILMVVLIYIGIRIVLASTAGEKAKYKERIIDWIIAMCLLFVMNYIMVFAVKIVDNITDLVEDAAGTNGNFKIINLEDEQSKNAKIIFEENEYGRKLVEKGVATLSADGKQLTWMTDLTGLFRIESQLTAEGTGKWVGYSFAYFVLVLFTLFFAWTYLKRVVYMAFLTMIAPLVAMTYPIDKITDGKAQAFNSWLKEYIFNLLIQPMHLLLYSLLISVAFELATDSPIYALVALGFMLPAEKLMRKFFGFEKASTPGLLGGAAGAALTMTGINKLLGHRPHGGKSGGKNSGESEIENSSSKGYTIWQNNSYKGMAEAAGIVPSAEGPSKVKAQSGARMPAQLKTKSGTGAGVPAKVKTQSGERTPAKVKAQSGARMPVKLKTKSGAGIPAKAKAQSGARTPVKLKTKSGAGMPTRRKGTLEKWYEHPVIKGTMASTGSYYRTLGKRIGKKIQNGHPIRALARGTAGLAGAATFGAMGLAAGIVSGDPSKAFQYAGGAALGGEKFASSTVDAAMKSTSVDQDYLQDQYEMEYYGAEYPNILYEREIQKKLKDEKTITDIQKALSVSRKKAVSRQEAIEILNSTGRQCMNSGISDAQDIAAIHEMTERPNTDISLKEAIYAKRISNQYSADPTSMMKDKLEKYEKTLLKNYTDAGFSEEEAENLKNRTIRIQSDLFNTKSSFNKVQL